MIHCKSLCSNKKLRRIISLRNFFNIKTLNYIKLRYRGLWLSERKIMIQILCRRPRHLLIYLLLILESLRSHCPFENSLRLFKWERFSWCCKWLTIPTHFIKWIVLVRCRGHFISTLNFLWWQIFNWTFSIYLLTWSEHSLIVRLETNFLICQKSVRLPVKLLLKQILINLTRAIHYLNI